MISPVATSTDLRTTSDTIERPSKPENTIFVGNKPFMNYVTAVVMQFTTKNSTEVHIQARGKFITRAVDVAEVATKQFLEKISVANVSIGSEEFEEQDGKNVRISHIDILLKKS